MKIRWRKLRSPQPYTKNCNHRKTAVSGRNSLAQGRGHQLVSPENRYTKVTFCRLNQLYLCAWISLRMYVLCICMCMLTTNEEVDHKFEGIQQGVYGRTWREAKGKVT